MYEGKKVVLMIEDDRTVRQMTIDILRENGYSVRYAKGSNDMDSLVDATEGWIIDNLDMLVLDMELKETQEGKGGDMSQSHEGEQMMGSQVWFILYLNYTDKLENVPFIIYSSKSPEEVQAYIQDLKDQDEDIKNLIEKNYICHIEKDEGAEKKVFEKIRETIG